MILLNYYKQVKENITKELFKAGIKNVKIHLYNDSVFVNSVENTAPVILFKYKDVAWQTSSQREYRATVIFNIYVVLNTNKEQDYTQALTLSDIVNETVLLHPTQEEIQLNIQELEEGKQVRQLIPNVVQKVKENQQTVEGDFWEKNNFFIWEIQFETSLIESVYKKRYTLITNNVFSIEDLSDPVYKEEIKNKLASEGIDLDFYLSLSEDDKVKLVSDQVTHEVKSLKNKIVKLNK